MLYLANELEFLKKFLCAKVISVSHFKTNPNILGPKRSIQSTFYQTVERWFLKTDMFFLYFLTHTFYLVIIQPSTFPFGQMAEPRGCDKWDYSRLLYGIKWASVGSWGPWGTIVGLVIEDQIPMSVLLLVWLTLGRSLNDFWASIFSL